MEESLEETEQLNNENKDPESSNDNGKPKKSIKKNYFYNLIYQLFLVIVPLIVTPYVSRVLTPTGIGQYSFSYSIIRYFLIFGNLGFLYYAQREIAKCRDDIKRQTIVFWEIIICRLIPVFLAIFVHLSFWGFGVYGDYSQLLLIFTLEIVAIAFDISFLFQGNENFGKLVARNVTIKILSIILIFLVVKHQNDLWKYTLINAGMLLLSNLALWSYLPKSIIRVSIHDLKPLKQFKGTIVLFIPTIATTIYTILDKTLIGVLINETYIEVVDGIEVTKKYSDLENGYYEQTEKVVKLAMTVITAIGTVMIPRNSYELSKGNINNVRKNLNTSVNLVFLIGLPMALGLMVISTHFVPWFFGNDYEKCIDLFYVLSGLIVIIGLSNVFGLQYLMPSGNEKKFIVALMCGAFTNIILNFILIPFLWSIGAAIATLTAEMLVTIIMSIMVRKEINILKSIITAWKIFLSSFIMFVSLFFLKRVFDSTVLNCFILVFIGIVIYGFSLILLREKLIIDTFKKIIVKIKKNK